MDIQTDNIIKRYRISKSFKALEDNKCPLCDSQQSDRTTLNDHITLCSIYFMRYNQIDVDQMVNHVNDKEAVRRGRCRLVIDFRRDDAFERQVDQVRRIIQQSKLLKYLTISFHFNDKLLEKARPYVNLIYQDLKKNTTIKEYSFYQPPFGSMIYAERPSTRFYISETRNIDDDDGDSQLHTPICLPSMIPHIDKYHVRGSADIVPSCLVLTGSPYIKTVKLDTAQSICYNIQVFNQFTLGLPNLECIRLKCDEAEEHMPVVIELLNRNQIKHMTIESRLNQLHCEQLFNAIKTNKSLISLRILVYLTGHGRGSTL
ncbi:hypothetical protein DFA_07975 [Cavenderia fasciculata]|uniref:Uncharacterized protein n=1 Tax=Cavenderia fasciculata TaxID=261658 RepID=F4Q4D2_CACFS|nr:uncharacterized protein DFA_07975 [Cavenderia fasciculata]EGG16994.1 hypothetical protein DFA_07975 [Cavenderia fasciculata]|eukprot:XP_004355478.1 hypothetical protein DFA_07975 [Cavenderia fasciculata]